MDGSEGRPALILTPFRLANVIEAVTEAVRSEGFIGRTSKGVIPSGNLVRDIVAGIHDAHLIVADLTFGNPNVMYELGLSHGFYQGPILICQTRPDGDWLVSEAGETMHLPFDLSVYDTIPYSATQEGLKALQAAIRERIRKSEGRRFETPVDTIREIIATNRFYTFMLYGALLGAIIGFAASIPTAAIGRSLVWEWHFQGRVVRTLMEGCGGGTYLGGACFAAYAAVYNKFEGRAVRWRRSSLIWPSILGGAVAGLLAMTPYLLIDLRQFAPEVAVAISVPHVILLTLMGLGFGALANIQPPGANPEPLSHHAARSLLFSILLLGIALGALHVWRVELLPEAYLAHYLPVDALSDGIRYIGVLTGLSIAHWWLKWKRRPRHIE